MSKAYRIMALLLAIALHASIVTAAQEATVKTRSGSVSGQVTGLLLLSRPITEPRKGVAYLVVEGATVRRIDESGVHLAPGSRVRAFFASGEGGGVPDLGLPWRFLQSMGPALRDSPQFSANIGCCTISTIVADALTDELLGEFQPESENAPVVPYLHIANGSGKTEVAVADVAKAAVPPARR